MKINEEIVEIARELIVTNAQECAIAIAYGGASTGRRKPG